jgi:DNA-binding MarR family transcriptional regulator
MVQRQIISKLQKTSQNWARQTDQILQERLGIGLAQLKIIDLLHDENVLSQRELADNLSQTEASISRQIKLMHQQGWLLVATDLNERRKRRVKLAPAGQRIVMAAQEIVNEQSQKMLQNVNLKQQQSLLDLLQKLNIN